MKLAITIVLALLAIPVVIVLRFLSYADNAWGMTSPSSTLTISPVGSALLMFLVLSSVLLVLSWLTDDGHSK